MYGVAGQNIDISRYYIQDPDWSIGYSAGYVNNRYLDYDVIHLKPKELQKKLEKADLVKKVKLGNEYIRILSVEKVFNFLKINTINKKQEK